MNIGAKVYVSLAAMAVIAFMVGMTGLEALDRFNVKSHEMETASRRAVLGERMDALIYAVVMDSRGIYLATNGPEAEKFVAPMLGNLDRLRGTLKDWKALFPDTEQGKFGPALTAAEIFIKLRSEFAEVARAGKPEEARKLGDNDANRQSRQTLNKEVRALAEVDAQDVQRLQLELVESYSFFRALVLATLVVGVSAGFFAVSVMVRRKIVGPLKALATRIDALGHGDHVTAVLYRDQKDEIGVIARAVEGSRVAAEANIAMEHQRTREREQAEADKRRALLAMAETVESEAGRAVEVVAYQTRSMQEGAARTTDSAQLMQRNAQGVMAAVHQALANSQGVAGAADELVATISEAGRQMTMAERVSATAIERAEFAEGVVSQLAGAVSKISEVTALITDIASQTNLLALNATIEAARAGDAGKGFAVVAHEVKNLANQTSRATDDISLQINEIQKSTDGTVSSVRDIIQAIHDLEAVSSEIAMAIEQQTQATDEIRRNATHTAQAVADVSERISVISAEAGQTGERAGDVGQIAEGVSKSIDELRTILIQTVRRATG